MKAYEFWILGLTKWLGGSGVALDFKGFVLTCAAAGDDRGALEISRRGIYAISDIRAASTSLPPSAKERKSSRPGTSVSPLLHRPLQRAFQRHIQPAADFGNVLFPKLAELGRWFVILEN
jgi:hypothetical protein